MFFPLKRRRFACHQTVSFMKISYLILLTMLLTAPIQAQPFSHTFALWPGQVPGAIREKGEPKTDTRSEGNVLRLTEVTDPYLAVFPPTGTSNGCAVVICPGGAYNLLAYDKEGTEIASWLAGLGYTAYVLAYRVPQQPEGALQDLQRALRVVRRTQHPRRVGVMGFSAGASLSARASTRFTERLYPPTDEADSLCCRPDFALLIYPAYLDMGPNRTLTPELTLTGQTPPMFIFATADDPYSNSALVMAQALRDHRLPVELHLLPQGGHGYGLRYGAGLVWPALAERWLRFYTTTDGEE